MPHLQTNCNDLKGEMALFSFPHTSGGGELRGVHWFIFLI